MVSDKHAFQLQHGNGKILIFLIKEEREKSKYLETRLMERSIEVEKLKAEIKLMKFVNNNLSTELWTDEDTNTVTIDTEQLAKAQENSQSKNTPTVSLDSNMQPF